jgi:hypothetical protein
MWPKILGSAGAFVAAYFFFMLTAFGGGGLVAPGRRPLSKGIERYINASLVAGPLFCGFFGLLPWLGVSGWFYALPPALVLAQLALILLWLSSK